MADRKQEVRSIRQGPYTSVHCSLLPEHGILVEVDFTDFL